ncbi:thioredoxin-disulfide reductase [bacterium]|nr:thioredoxin-disulfide reductase [bacterium]
MMEKKVIIIGAGPAGLTAGIYTSRGGIKTLLIEKFMPGGNMLMTEKIENYPGFPEGIGGIELAELMKKQVLNSGGEIIQGEVKDVNIGDEKEVILKNGERLKTPALIIASGSSRKKLGVEGEEKLKGKGVSYCAACDGPFFRDKTIAVVGGGDSALEEAIYLTRFASKIYLIHRREEFRASKFLQEKIKEYPKIQPVLSSIVEKIEGENKVESIIVKNIKTGEEERIKVNGVFISIGQKPNVEFLNGKLKADPSGYLIVNENMETSEKGVFACGDVIRKTLYQVITACGEGAIAGWSVEKYLSSL